MPTGIIRFEDASDCEPWQAPSMSDHSLHSRSGLDAKACGALTAGELENVESQAHSEGWQAGHREGLEAGAADLAARIANLDTILAALAVPFGDLDCEIEEQVLLLAMTLTRQIIRREVRLNPDHVMGVVREAVAALPVSSRDVTIRLHPTDAALVRDCMSAGEPEQRAWRLEEDLAIERGDCTVNAASSEVDATLDTRLTRIVNSMLDDERATDG